MLLLKKSIPTNHLPFKEFNNLKYCLIGEFEFIDNELILKFLKDRDMSVFETGNFALITYDQELKHTQITTSKLFNFPLYYNKKLDLSLSIWSIDSKRTITKELASEYIFFNGNLFGKTIYNDIFRLQPFRSYLFRNNQIEIQELKTIPNNDKINLEYRFKNFSNKLENIYKNKKVSLGVSGGMDSRILLEILNKTSIKLEAFYFGNVGNDLTNAKKLCKLYNTSLSQYNFNNTNIKENYINDIILNPEGSCEVLRTTTNIPKSDILLNGGFGFLVQQAYTSNFLDNYISTKTLLWISPRLNNVKRIFYKIFLNKNKNFKCNLVKENILFDIETIKNTLNSLGDYNLENYADLIKLNIEACGQNISNGYFESLGGRVKSHSLYVNTLSDYENLKSGDVIGRKIIYQYLDNIKKLSSVGEQTWRSNSKNPFKRIKQLFVFLLSGHGVMNYHKRLLNKNLFNYTKQKIDENEEFIGSFINIKKMISLTKKKRISHQIIINTCKVSHLKSLNKKEIEHFKNISESSLKKRYI